MAERLSEQQEYWFDHEEAVPPTWVEDRDEVVEPDDFYYEELADLAADRMEKYELGLDYREV